MKKLLTLAAILSLVVGSQIVASYQPNPHTFSPQKYYDQNTSGLNASIRYFETSDSGAAWYKQNFGGDPLYTTPEGVAKYNKLQRDLQRLADKVLDRGDS